MPHIITQTAKKNKENCSFHKICYNRHIKRGDYMLKIESFINEENKKLNYKDYLTLLTIIIIYGFISFHNLGSMTNPNTFHNFSKTDSLVIELNKKEDIIKMKSFNGDKNAEYQVYVSDDNKKYHYVTKITGEGAFAWDDIRLITRGKYLKFLFTEESSLGEIALYNNSKKIIKVESSYHDKKKINTLTDEPNLIPKQASYYNSTYFDEIYFARTAYEYTKRMETYEWTHPPLGKLIQALPIYITKNMSPFNYRLMGNLSGILMIIVIYNFGKLLFKKRKYAIFSALLMTLDTFHFVQTRIGTVDSHLVLFILCSLYFMCKFVEDSKTRNLFLSGVFFTFAISVKWTGLYAGLALAIIYFTYLFRKKKFNLAFITKGTAFFVIIPIIFYFGLYLLFPNNRINYTNNIPSVINQQKEMYNYHSTLESDHFFSSSWYTWPVVYKPVWYHNQKVDNNNRETITAVGNIIIWWTGIISTIYLLIKTIRKKDKNSFLLLIIILSLWIPYSVIGRVMFLYHYFPVLPFLILSIVLMFKDIVEKSKKDIIIPIYLVLALAFFVIYYPVISGKVVDNNYIERLKLFDSWYF